MGTQKKFSLDTLLKLLTMVVMISSMAACSSSKTSDDESLSDGGDSAELAEAGTDEVPEDSLEDIGGEDSFGEDLPEGQDLADNGAPVDEMAPEKEPAIPETSEEMATTEEPVAPEESFEQPAAPQDDYMAAPQDMAQPAVNEFQSESSSSGFSGGTESYTVRGGDTLMKIAFEHYGDLYQWKRIYEANRDKISDPNMIPSGTVLNIEKPASSVVIDRNGERYKIKQGDTLGSISAEVYGNSGKWKKLWNNNRTLIKDPNKIFAGFELYYLPEAGYPNQMASPEAPTPGHQEVQAVIDESGVDPGVQPDMRIPANSQTQ